MKTALKNIIINKNGQRSQSVINMLLNCRFDNTSNKVYTGYYSGSGRFTSAHSALPTIELLLKAQGYKYTIANDAVRGGAKGEHIVISKIAYNFLLSIKNKTI
jgi:hypothetical protein